MRHRFFRTLLRHRFVALIALTAITVAFGRLLVDPGQLLVDFSLEALLVPDDRAQADLEALRRDFGDDVGMVGVIVALPGDDERTVFAPAVLDAIAGLAGWLEGRPEIDRDRIVTVLDLPDLRGEEIVPEALRQPATDPHAVGRVLLAHGSFRHQLLSPDGRATLVVAPFSARALDQRRELLTALEARARTMAEAIGGGAEVHLVGVPLVQVAYASVVLRDIVLLAPITILVIAALLGLAFRRVYAVVGPLAGVGLATIWTLGLIQALGMPFDIVNSVSGVVILVVGIAEGAHIVARHREEVLRLAGQGNSREAAILATMERMAPACFVTSATTAVGFGSLASAALPAISSFGAVLAAGVMMAWAVQMVLMPIVLSFLHLEAPADRQGGDTNGLFSRGLDATARLVLRRHEAFVTLALGSVVIAVIGTFFVRADARAAGELQPEHPVARGLAVMEERLSGVLIHSVALSGRAGGTCSSDADCAPSGPRSRPVCRRVDLAYRTVRTVREAAFELTDSRSPALFDDLEEAIRGDGFERDELEPDGVCSESVVTPDVTGFIADLQAFVAAVSETERAAGHRPLIASSHGIVDLLVDLGRGASPPRDAAIIAERIGVLEAGAPELTGLYLTPDHTRTQLVLRANDIGLAAWRELKPRLDEEIDRLVARHGLAGRVGVGLSGGATLAEQAVSGVAQSLADSVLYDLLLILAFIAGLVRNLRLTLLAMLPNIWPLLVTLGTMGLLDVPLRASTVIVFSIALGIAVNDTTHFIYRYREEVQRSGEGPEAIRRTLMATGRPIVLTSLILVAGFMVNGLSDFKAIVEMGMLSAVTLGLALVADLFLTPALLLVARGRLGRL